MRTRRTFLEPGRDDRPTERQALNNLTLAELEDMALQVLRKRQLNREWKQQQSQFKRR